jgi:CheY-like chemotaxis protein
MGATFTVRLPIIPTQPTVNQAQQLSEACFDLNGVSILVVDDDTDTRELLAFLLEQAGAKVITAASANEALATLTQTQPQVLISDIGMPEMDGYMLIQLIRALPPEQGGEIPAIALTAYAGELNQQQALQAGFQRHLSKPVDPTILMQMIADMMQHSIF